MSVPQSHKAPTPRYRAGVALRTLIAIIGGYALAALMSAALAVWLPIARVEAALTATMAGLIIYPCAIMWCFAARSAPRALAGLLLAALPFALLLALGRGGAA